MSVTERLLFSVLVVVFTCCFSSQVFSQGPENTLVVVNEESPDPLAIANTYVDLRNIPASSVVYLKGISHSEKLGDEASSSSLFLSQIGQPVMAAMKDRGLEKQIDCITYSAGFPARFNVQPEMKKYLKQRGLKYNIRQHAPWASITSLTYLYNNAFSSRPRFFELDTNQYASIRPQKLMANPFVGSAAKQYDSAQKLIAQRDFPRARKILSDLGADHPEQMAVK